MTRLAKSLGLAMVAAVALAAPLGAEEIGSVSTVFKAIGPNDKIVVEAFDDPKVAGVTCYLSRTKLGGIKGAMGIVEEPDDDAAISCRRVGPVQIAESFRDGETVFKTDTSLLFKTMQVVRFFDRKRNVLVYLVYSDKIIEGSPKNSVSAVSLDKNVAQ
ncbi:CreA family protein [Phaeospirillum tilakii]|uniref:CreA family protein n=1 Tax=Phaeospirillum tilakii TaxID=741673 RepID=A0ABW5CF62_9PROT